jgi:hypothetical protein
MTEERSPIMPAPMMAGEPFGGPSLLESVLNRRFRSLCSLTFVFPQEAHNLEIGGSNPPQPIFLIIINRLNLTWRAPDKRIHAGITRCLYAPTPSGLRSI